MKKIKIVEYFFSLQGEGLFVGVPSFFIRFPNCNLACRYCDTDFNSFYEIDMPVILEEYRKYGDIPVVFTGGEPLLHTEEIQFFANYMKNIYLETNGTLHEEMKNVKDVVDFISMDIKLPSSSGHTLWDDHVKFANVVKNRHGQFKVVFDNNISDYEIEKIIEITNIIPSWIIIFQPVYGEETKVSEVMHKIISSFNVNRVRFIPQIHKILNIQ